MNRQIAETAVQRVQRFIDAVDQENARNADVVAPVTELAWAVPDAGGLVALTVADVRALLPATTDPAIPTDLALSDRSRAIISVWQREDQQHPADIADVATADLEARWHRLHRWETAATIPDALADPRCGCGADNEGGRCYWDDLGQIDDELTRRRVR